MEAPRRKRSRCRCALGLALLFDALGLAGLLLGGLLESAVSDLLIYLGGVGVFFSLPWWVFWHVGNLEVPAEELRDDVGLGWRSADAWSLESWRARRLALLARAFSAHFSLPSAGTSASSRSQVGRPHARFAASAASTRGSDVLSARPSEAEELQRPLQVTQDEAVDTATLARATPPFSLPATSFVSVGTPAPQESLESTASAGAQDHATQTSIFSITGWRKTT
ncbi:transmembrane protein 238-like [Erythrolamprus reginae]|uniref:transmembrane protein 238-like n=1 Tax=Erythrolamprus reginae TaxID=121349 RepID=UPI00396C6C07